MKSFFAAALLAAMCLLMVGWFDHHAAEYDPQHTHLVPGLIGLALDLGVISHEHAFVKEHSHRQVAESALMSTTGPGVAPATSLSPIGKGSSVAIVPLKHSAPVDLHAVGNAPAFVSAQFLTEDPAPIDPPPRSDS